MEGPTKLFIVRHGERADRHPSARTYQVTFDPCLTEKGVQQSERTAEYLESLIGQATSVHIVSSPFLRCIETAEKLAVRVSLPVHIEEGFGEYMYEEDFSSDPFDHLAYTVARAQTGVGVKLIENPHVLRPVFPESFDEVFARSRRAWELYLPLVKEDVLVLFTHLYVLTGVTTVLTGRSQGISEQGYCKMTYSDNGVVQLNCDSSHLTISRETI